MTPSLAGGEHYAPPPPQNLWFGIRDETLKHFQDNRIVWHTGALPGYPSNHLCSSQVFLVNFLAPFQSRRGVGNASIAFIILGRTTSGTTVLVLGEANYTEHYPANQALRHHRLAIRLVDSYDPLVESHLVMPRSAAQELFRGVRDGLPADLTDWTRYMTARYRL